MSKTLNRSRRSDRGDNKVHHGILPGARGRVLGIVDVPLGGCVVERRKRSARRGLFVGKKRSRAKLGRARQLRTAAAPALRDH